MSDSSLSPTALPPSSSPTTIAFVNFHSGGQMGPAIITALRSLLGEENVFNLADGGPSKGLISKRELWSTGNLRVVAIGGDGTVNWVLSVIGELGITPPPPVGIIPLGTGNDTSRVFGWGHAFPGERGIIRNINFMREYERNNNIRSDFNMIEEDLDRWKVTIRRLYQWDEKSAKNEKDRGKYPPAVREVKKIHPNDNGDRESNGQNNPTSPSSVPVAIELSDIPSSISSSSTSSSPSSSSSPPLLEAEFNNYLSFGIDALNMYKFHHHRENNRGCYRHRLQNMVNMAVCGAITCFCCQAERLQFRVYVPKDENESMGEEKKNTNNSNSLSSSPSAIEWSELILPVGLKSIALLNIPSYAAGRNPWGTPPPSSSFVPQNYHDGLLEVFGIWGDVHLTRMMIGCADGVRIGQYSALRVVMRESETHIQIDGEAFKEEKSEFIIQKIGRAKMIRRKVAESPKTQRMD